VLALLIDCITVLLRTYEPCLYYAGLKTKEKNISLGQDVVYIVILYFVFLPHSDVNKNIQ